MYKGDSYEFTTSLPKCKIVTRVLNILVPKQWQEQRNLPFFSHFLHWLWEKISRIVRKGFKIGCIHILNVVNSLLSAKNSRAFKFFLAKFCRCVFCACLLLFWLAVTATCPSRLLDQMILDFKDSYEVLTETSGCCITQEHDGSSHALIHFRRRHWLKWILYSNEV